MHYFGDANDKDDDVTTHGDHSPDPGEESYTDPLVGEGSGKDETGVDR